MKIHSGFSRYVCNVVIIVYICLCPDIRSPFINNGQFYEEHFLFIFIIIIMFKEVKIQYTINLTLLRTSLFFFGNFSIFRDIKKVEWKIPFDPLSFGAHWVNVHCGLFVMDFFYYYDCQYEISIIHKKIKVLFWFIFNFTVGHFECVYSYQ